MDAGHRIGCRHRITACTIIMAGCLISVGCSLTSKVTSDSTLSRAQSPDSPVAPAGPVVMPSSVPAITPSATVVPTTALTPAPISTETQPTIMSSAPLLAEQATQQVHVAAIIGDGVFITSDEVWQMVRQRLSSTPPKQMNVEQQKAYERKLYEEELLTLIKRELILSDFLTKIKKNKPQVLDDLNEEASRMAKKTFAAFKAQNHISSEDKLIAALQAQGMSYKVLQRQLERNAMLTLYMGTFLKDKGKNISIAELQRYYDENPNEFKTKDHVKWLDLFVSYSRFNTPAEAQQRAMWLAQQLQSGADFVQLVKDHGHGDSKLRDGEGIGDKPGEIQPAELAPTILALKAGQTSGIIPTQTGLHIVKVTERQVAGIRPFDEKVQGFIRMKLMTQIQDLERDKLIEDLWRRTTVKIVDVPK